MNTKMRYFTADGKPFLALTGEVHNSSSTDPERMEGIWEKAEYLHLNTLALPVSWDLLEEKEGYYDFSMADVLIRQARSHHMHIIFLWFGSFKNAQSTYAPEWVKRDLMRFPRAEIQKGRRKIVLHDFYDMEYSSLSVFSRETLRKDREAFAAFMEHLRESDAEDRTVLMVQVENETGIMGAAREHSARADRKYAEGIPGEFMKRLRCCVESWISERVKPGCPDNCRPDYYEKWEHWLHEIRRYFKELEAGTDVFGTKNPAWCAWDMIFGDDAEEAFQAYYTASFVNAVAAGGKKVYGLPMAVNAWLSQGGTAGKYPSGGPVAHMLPVWEAAAPEIDVVAPDIYVKDFGRVCEEYRTEKNPLCVLETATHSHLAPRMLYAVGHFHAFCFGPFAFEDMGKPFDAKAAALFGVDTTDPLLAMPQDMEVFRTVAGVLGSMGEMTLEAFSTDRLQAVIAESPDGAEYVPGQSKCMRFGTVKFTAVFSDSEGAALILQKGDEEFFLFAMHCQIVLSSVDPVNDSVELLRVEEGTFENMRWIPGRKLNGDETAELIFKDPYLIRLTCWSFPSVISSDIPAE